MPGLSRHAASVPVPPPTSPGSDAFLDGDSYFYFNFDYSNTVIVNFKTLVKSNTGNIVTRCTGGMIPPGGVMKTAGNNALRTALEDVLSKTADRKALLDWASKGWRRFSSGAGDIFGRVNAGAARAASAARKHTASATDYLGRHKRRVAGIGGLGGAGMMLVTPEMAETMSSLARSGYVYGRRALRLDDAVSAANGEYREDR